jgi:hypothetical protein
VEVKNLFEKSVYEEVMERIGKLGPDSQRQWGKMTVAQMLAHCKRAFRVPLSEKPLPRMFPGRLVGWLIRHKLYDSKPYAKGLPTAPGFIIRDERDFVKEKTELIGLVSQFYQRGPEHVGKHPHPFFGSLTSEQWGRSMWKHLDHHLRQFNV